MSNEDFINSLIAKMTREIAELNKTKFILETQVEQKDRELQEMTELKNRLENANNDLVKKSKKTE